VISNTELKEEGARGARASVGSILREAKPKDLNFAVSE